MKHCLFLILLVTFITGCNTMRGAGQDVEAVGDSVQRAAG